MQGVWVLVGKLGSRMLWGLARKLKKKIYVEGWHRHLEILSSMESALLLHCFPSRPQAKLSQPSPERWKGQALHSFVSGEIQEKNRSCMATKLWACPLLSTRVLSSEMSQNTAGRVCGLHWPSPSKPVYSRLLPLSGVGPSSQMYAGDHVLNPGLTSQSPGAPS